MSRPPTGRTPARRRRRAAAPPPQEVNALADWGINHRQQRILTIVAVAVFVIVGSAALTAAIVTLGGGVRAEQTTAAIGFDRATPAGYQGWTSPELFAPIAARAAGAEPLTTKEIFGAKTLKSGKATLRLVTSRADADCAAAAWGTLAEALADAGCTQVVRGLFTSPDDRYVAQYTLFDLSDTAAADGLVTTMKTGYSGGWAVPLPAEEVTFPADGYTEASGHAMGHYAGLVWIARRDGAEPQKADDFVTLALAVRGAEKGIYRRVVAAGPKEQ